MYYVYMIQCQDGKIYTGMTENLERRIKEHRYGKSHITSYNPFRKLIHTQEFPDKELAAKREKQLKGWTRAKKLALANGDLKLLKKL